MPSYFHDEFKDFLKTNDACHNEGTGYMFIRLDKEDSYYRSGETVKGTVYFELFHQSAQTELNIKFEGVQIVPKHIIKRIRGEDDSQEQSSESAEGSESEFQ